MRVYALYGTSGTGKSSTALTLAHRLNIDAIIDDGILIHQGRKVAGTSAKYEKTKIQAVKRAIFLHPEHAAEVRRALRSLPIHRLLVLATSKRMVQRIIQALDLPDVYEYIPIESVKSAQEIEAARYVRETQGKHVIPVPRVEVEKDFFHRLIESAQQILSPKKEVIGETTVVHPPFAGGRIQIHEQVLKKIVQVCCRRIPEVAHVNKSAFSFETLPRLRVSVTLRLPFGASIPALVRRIQQALHEEIGFCLNITPASIDVEVRALILTPKRQA